MCIAIVKPAKTSIHREVLEECFRMNRDGAGFAFHDPEKGTVHYSKGYFDFDSFYKAYEPYKNHKCLIHFRVATHKNVDGPNCHPWRVNKNLVFIHNGKISGMDRDDTLSDTGNFCVLLGELLESAPDFYTTPEFKWFATNAIGSGNKLAFLDSQGNHVIINEAAGNWKDGVWFSNLSYGCKRSREVGVLDDHCYPAEPAKETPEVNTVNTTPKELPPSSPADERNIPITDSDPAALLAAIVKDGQAFVEVKGEQQIDEILREVNKLQFAS